MHHNLSVADARRGLLPEGKRYVSGINRAIGEESQGCLRRLMGTASDFFEGFVYSWSTEFSKMSSSDTALVCQE